MTKNITISVPDDLAKEMETFPEINWSEVARQAFWNVVKGRKDQWVHGNIKELILRYKNYEKWAELDALRQLSEILIEDEYVADNIKQRYNTDGMAVLAQVKEDLREMGIEDVRQGGYCDTISQYFEDHCEDDFKKRVEERITKSPKQIKDAMNIIAYYGAILDSKGPLTVSSFATKLSSDEIERELTKNGLVDRYHFSSNAYSHLAWNIPKYSQSILKTIRDNPETYGIPKADRSAVDQLLKKDSFREFIEWIQQKGTQTQPFGSTYYVPENEFDSKRQNFNMKYGQGSFEEAVGKLVESQMLQVNFSPDRRRTGKRESKPAEYIFKLHPDLIERFRA